MAALSDDKEMKGNPWKRTYHSVFKVGGPLRLRLEAKEMSLFFTSDLQPPTLNP